MIDKKSRYLNSLLIKDGSTEYLGNRPVPEVTPRFDDRFHEVVEGDRIDALAFHYLGDASLWWIIADYNEIAFPLELEVGNVLRIPTLETVEMKVFN